MSPSEYRQSYKDSLYQELINHYFGKHMHRARLNGIQRAFLFNNWNLEIESYLDKVPISIKLASFLTIYKLKLILTPIPESIL